MERFRASSLVAVLGGLCMVMVLYLFVPSSAFGQGQPLRTKHVREAVSNGQAAWAGRLPATLSLRLNVALPLRNESELNELLQQLYDPQSASYHQFLSVEEFTEQFGPSEEDYNQVINYAKAHGLTVTGTAPNRVLVNVTGSVANIEQAFHVNMGMYRHPTENRTFYAPRQGAFSRSSVCVMAHYGFGQLFDPPSGQSYESGESAPLRYRFGTTRVFHRQRHASGLLHFNASTK
jgi:subtilase family serine protease